MRRVSSIMIFSAAIVGLLAVTTVFGPPDNRGGSRYFIGFWEGVDVLDGSTMQISMTDLDRDGELELRYTESHFSSCFDKSSNTQGRGIYTGTAIAVGPNSILVEGSKVCINDDDTSEAPEPFQLTGEADRRDDILVLTGQGFLDPIILHRTDK